ncbi:MAG TPA: methionine adenosyltransferase [Steroidobacteraceae bacterium]|nr:methionine adenosyltransferase [Steroidobacteraceae bacterium]
MQLNISLLAGASVADAPVEVVERKGIGHPDTLCDALVEELSRSLSRFYLERFGHILHHNVDKALLFGGASAPRFGGGTVLAPMEIYLCGRATLDFGGVKVPVEQLAVEGSRQWLKAHLHGLDPERHVRIHCLIRPSSSELVDLFLRGQSSGRPLANDTSCGVGYAPFDGLETAVLAVEKGLNAPDLKRAAPEIGEDIKVMGVRTGERIELTVACALIDRHVANLPEYLAKRARVADSAADLARAAIGRDCVVAINAADGDTPESIYLTVTGTSAEAGDDGEVGRGNRATGLITPYRPMSIEAVAGKNPVSHVGKLYNLIAARIAVEAVAGAPGVLEACCTLVSRIGRPIQEPEIADVRVRLAPHAELPRSTLGEIAQAQLSRADTLWRDLLAGAPRVY